MAGHVDVADGLRVRGWASPDDGKPYGVVDILVDGDEVGKALAARRHEGLERQGIPGYGFEYQFDPPIGLFWKTSVEARAGGQVLPPGRISIPPLLVDREGYAATLDRPFWSAFSAAVAATDGSVRVTAQLLAPPDAFTLRALSGSAITSASVAEDQQKVQREPGWRVASVKPHTAVVAFVPKAGLSVEVFRIEPAGGIEDESNTLAPIELAVPVTEDWHTMPGPENWERTSGRGSRRDVFIFSGVDTAYTIDRIIKRFAGRRADFKILDWGIGCGRVAVPLKRLFRPDDTIQGVEVDSFNAAWCNANLTDISVEHSPIYPPLGFESGSFDAIYGVSVMTHLTQASQAMWLRELARLLRPGGLCILTAHGDHHLIERRLPPLTVERLRMWGIDDHPADSAVSVDEPGYYRATTQLRQFTVESWSAVLPIVAYLPAAHRMQDVVVMRKPS